MCGLPIRFIVSGLLNQMLWLGSHESGWLDEWLCLALQVLALSLLSHELGTRPPVPTHRPGPSVTPISSLNSYHSLGFCCSDLTGSKPGAGPCLLYTEWLCCQHPEDGGVRRWGLWEGRG